MNSMKPRALALAGGLLIAASLLGCGSSDNGVASKSAQEILAATRDTAQRASSVHIISKSSVAGATLALNMILAKNASHGQASLFGLDLQLVRVGDTLYVKGNQAFNRRLERRLGVKVPAGVWLKGPATGALKGVAGFADIKTEVPLVLSGSGAVSKGATTMIAGQPAIELKQAHKLSTASIYVATTGEPYPLQLRKRGRETGRTTLTGWNDPVTAAVPANAVDIGQLEHIKGG